MSPGFNCLRFPHADVTWFWERSTWKYLQICNENEQIHVSRVSCSHYQPSGWRLSVHDLKMSCKCHSNNTCCPGNSLMFSNQWSHNHKGGERRQAIPRVLFHRTTQQGKVVLAWWQIGQTGKSCRLQLFIQHFMVAGSVSTILPCNI